MTDFAERYDFCEIYSNRTAVRIKRREYISINRPGITLSL